jgi:iron complex transport system substrate-binding protein
MLKGNAVLYRSSLTRRRTLAFAGLGALGFRGAALTGQAATPVATGLGPIPAGGADSAGWSFTDDRGVAVQLDAAPSAVVAYLGIAAALHDFGYDVAGFFSGESRDSVDPATVAPNLPFDAIEDLGFGDAIDVEKLVSIGVDLFVGANYDLAGAQAIWPVPDDVMTQIGAFAGVVAIAYADGTDVDRLIQTNGNLAAALGADLNASSTQAAQQTYAAGLDALGAAVAGKPGLKALFMTGASDGFYVGQGLADLNFYAQQGLDVVSVDSWDLQSWESFANLAADVIFVDDRASGWLQPDQMAEQISTWSVHPAVAAGQVHPWRVEYVPSYQGFAPILEEMASEIGGASILS